jgi:signal peptidase II
VTAGTAIPIGVLILDQLTKTWVRASMTLNETIPIVGDMVRLTYIHNEGAAFGLSIGSYSSPVFLLLATIASALVLYLLLTAPRAERMQRVALALILGGALGNIIDRIRWSMVIDFIQVGVAGHFWPIFNVADSAVTIGAAMLAWTYLFKD